MLFQIDIGNMLQIQRRVYPSDLGSRSVYMHNGTHPPPHQPWGANTAHVESLLGESRAREATQASWNTLTRWPRFSCMQLVSLGASLINKVVLENNTWHLKFLLICNQ